MRDPKADTASVASSVELFGALLGRLSLPFADRGHELAAAGLGSDAALARTQAEWIARFTGGDEQARALWTRFAAAHEAARTGATGANASPSVAADSRFLTPEAQPWREEAAAVSLAVGQGVAPPLARAPAVEAAPPPAVAPPPPSLAEPNVDETCTAIPIYTPPLPFPAGSANAASSFAVSSPKEAPRDSDDGNETVELRLFVGRPATPFEAPATTDQDDPADRTAALGVVVASPALPFSPPGSASPAPERAPPAPQVASRKSDASVAEDVDDDGETVVPISLPNTAPLPFHGGTERRLIYFDPQTGEKLATPTWVESPKKPSGA